MQLAGASQEAYVRERPEPSWPTLAWSPPTRRTFAGNEIRYLVFDPLSTRADTARINPLDGVRVGTPYEVRDAERLAEALLGTHRQTSHTFSESHFAEHGARALAALMLHVLYTPDTERTLAAALRTVTDPLYYDISTLVDAICHATHDHDAKMGWRDSYGRPTHTHPAIVQRLRAASIAREGEQSGNYTTLTRGLAIFGDPLVARNTEVTDFDFDDLFNGLAISLRVPSGRRMQPLIDGIATVLEDRLKERLRYGPLRYPPFLSLGL